MQWHTLLSDNNELRQRMEQEIEFAKLYKQKFSHGTDGHIRLTLIAIIADILDLVESDNYEAIQELIQTHFNTKE